MSDKRERWIDAMKAIAIIAVIIDHVNGTLYFNDMFRQFFGFSVGLFFIVAGYNMYSSLDKRKITSYNKVWVRDKLIAFLVPYIIASVIVQVMLDYKFDLSSIIVNIVLFQTIPPYYFTLVYAQYIIIAQLIYFRVVGIDESDTKIINILTIVSTLVLISILSYYYTIINPALWGSGQKLFGSSYILLFCFGMLWHKIKSKKHIIGYILSVVCIIITSLWKLNIIVVPQNNYSPLIDSDNPPGVLMIIYTVGLFYVFYTIFDMMEKNKSRIINRVMGFLEKLGKKSMTIYLYHWVIIIYYQRFVIPHINGEFFDGSDMVYILRFAMFLGAFIFPLLGSWICKHMNKVILNNGEI